MIITLGCRTASSPKQAIICNETPGLAAAISVEEFHFPLLASHTILMMPPSCAIKLASQVEVLTVRKWNKRGQARRTLELQHMQVNRGK
jgi:hypothetical protein